MPVISSIIVRDDTQADGSRRVREEHTVTGGKVWHRNYSANAGEDVTAAMNGRVDGINAHLRQVEEDEFLAFAIAGGDLTTATPIHINTQDLLWRRMMRVQRQSPALIAVHLVALWDYLDAQNNAPQLQALLDRTGPQVQAQRARNVDLATIKTLIEADDPLVEEL